ncbi:MAG TPA: class I SAM-dependent methyltransferase [Fibrobacteria bacterium]|nr:class I SAM-dependent methyltransferase [Fibrobacteria bacterium]
MGQLIGRASFFVPGPPAEIGQASSSLMKFVAENAVGSIFDLGGGKGAYSMELKKAGFDVTLGEIDPIALKSAKDHGLTAVDTTETSLDQLQGGFDTVLLLEVLEHVEDFDAFLAKAFACARKRLLLTVPCNDDFEELFQLGLSYNHIAVTDHVNHFTSYTLFAALEKLGCKFQIEKGDFLFKHAFLSLVIQKIRSSLLGWFVSWALRAYYRIGNPPRLFPSRFFVVVWKDPS